jgi:hypothetical protein
MRTAVLCEDERKATAHRIADRQAVLLVPEGQGVEERLTLGVLELLDPSAAAVGRLINPRVRSRSGTQQVRGRRAERLDVAKIELVRTGHHADRPRLTAVRRAAVRALGAANPGHLGTHGRQSAEVRTRVDRLRLPLGLSRRLAQRQSQRRNEHGSEDKNFHPDPPVQQASGLRSFILELQISFSSVADAVREIPHAAELRR